MAPAPRRNGCRPISIPSQLRDGHLFGYRLGALDATSTVPLPSFIPMAVDLNTGETVWERTDLAGLMDRECFTGAVGIWAPDGGVVVEVCGHELGFLARSDAPEATVTVSPNRVEVFPDSRDVADHRAFVNSTARRSGGIPASEIDHLVDEFRATPRQWILKPAAFRFDGRGRLWGATTLDRTDFSYLEVWTGTRVRRPGPRRGPAAGLRHPGVYARDARRAVARQVGARLVRHRIRLERPDRGVSNPRPGEEKGIWRNGRAAPFPPPAERGGLDPAELRRCGRPRRGGGDPPDQKGGTVPMSLTSDDRKWIQELLGKSEERVYRRIKNNALGEITKRLDGDRRPPRLHGRGRGEDSDDRGRGVFHEPEHRGPTRTRGHLGPCDTQPSPSRPTPGWPSFLRQGDDQ